jgi:LPXTG-motif cell wall-anchored protein
VSRAALRLSCAVLLAVVMTAGASCLGAPAARAARQGPCPEPGKVYTQRVLVTHKNKRVDLTTLFLVCRPSHVLAIVDSEGGSYRDLDDLRAHNHLFGADDKITLPRDFPSLDTANKPDLVTVSAHTGSSSAWWWVIGAAVLVLLAGGGLLWLRRLRRPGPADTADTAEPPEPAGE